MKVRKTVNESEYLKKTAPVVNHQFKDSNNNKIPMLPEETSPKYENCTFNNCTFNIVSCLCKK